MAFPWAIAIPAAVSALSGLFGKKKEDAQAQQVDVKCQAENQRRIALMNAVGKAYGLDIKGSPELSALAAPRPCPNVAAGNTYGLLQDVLGGGALALGSAMTPGGQPQSNPSEQIPGIGNAPCAPGTVRNVFTGECVPPEQAGSNPDALSSGS